MPELARAVAVELAQSSVFQRIFAWHAFCCWTRMRDLALGWAFAAGLALLGCSSSGDSSQASGDGSRAEPPSGTDFGSAAPSTGSGAGPSTSAGSIETSTDPSAPPGDTGNSTSTGSPLPQAGQLTAGAWDDNRNFDRFTSYRAGLDAAQLLGLPPITPAQYQAANALLTGFPGGHQQLDVAFVIDTTGSMTDELAYLQSEFISIAKSIDDAYPNAAQRWSLLLYRDHSDIYLTRVFDFTTDAAAFQQNLAAQNADGGGDFPEAPDVALTQAATLDWRTDATVARLAFWVADAPHHVADAPAMSAALLKLQAKDIHVYPVAASGVDELTELTMRSAAQLTGGRYLFLTNDSGIGNDHKEPSIPCYFVTLLDKAILRMVDIELTGVYKEPAAADIIRTGGNPQDGACQLDSGDTAFVF
jgi:hypothetical protein